MVVLHEIVSLLWQLLHDDVCVAGRGTPRHRQFSQSVKRRLVAYYLQRQAGGDGTGRSLRQLGCPMMQIFVHLLLRRGGGRTIALMEHETSDPDVLATQRARAIDPPRATLTSEVAATEQTAIGPAVRTPAAALRPPVVMGLQRTAGNAAVRALLQRRLAPTEGQDDQEAASSVRDIIGKGGGQPLDRELRGEMEGRLGHDFSDVRIHTDADAARSAAAVSARAYTVGHEVVFGRDSPALDSAPGKHTLAHELTHVVQQRTGPVAGTPTGDGISISDPSDVFEQAAEANAARVMAVRRPDTHVSDSGASAAAQREVWQRDPADTDMVGLEDEEEEDEEDLAETEVEDQAEFEADEDEEEDSLQGIWMQRDPDATGAASAPDGSAAPADGSAPAADGSGAPTVDQFSSQFNTDEIVSDMIEEGSDMAGAGAGDLAPDASQSESPAPTAQAMSLSLSLQRDPPAGSPPAPAGASPQTADPTAAAPAVQPGSAGKVLAALAAVPEFKAALEQIKAAVIADWKQIVAATTPAEKVALFTVAGAIVGGGAAGAMGNPSSRSFLLDQVNNQKIDIPGLSGLSVTPKTANGGFQGGVINLDVYKMFPALRNAVPGVTN
jgi:Domain of unknown function (DUF4157)